MNDDNNIFGEVLEQGAAQVKQGASDAVAQVTGQNVGDSSDETKKVVEGLYEKSPDKNQNQNQQNQNQHQNVVQNLTNQVLGVTQSPEVQAQLEVVRKELHSAYYQNLVNPPKQEEESVVEKIEREDQQKDWDLKQKEMAAPPPLAVQMGQSHAEKFPGASG